jgi:hypothetical protein
MGRKEGNSEIPEKLTVDPKTKRQKTYLNLMG